MFPDESQTFDDLDVDSIDKELIQAETRNVLGIRSKAMDRSDEITNVEQRDLDDINNLIKQRWVSFDLSQNHEKLNEAKKGRIIQSLAKGTKSVSFSLTAQVVDGCGIIYNYEVTEDGGLGPCLFDFDPRSNKEPKLAYI
jgi:hypothetical protein